MDISPKHKIEYIYWNLRNMGHIEPQRDRKYTDEEISKLCFHPIESIPPFYLELLRKSIGIMHYFRSYAYTLEEIRLRYDELMEELDHNQRAFISDIFEKNLVIGCDEWLGEIETTQLYFLNLKTNSKKKTYYEANLETFSIREINPSFENYCMRRVKEKIDSRRNSAIYDWFLSKEKGNDLSLEVPQLAPTYGMKYVMKVHDVFLSYNFNKGIKDPIDLRMLEKTPNHEEFERTFIRAGKRVYKNGVKSNKEEAKYGFEIVNKKFNYLNVRDPNYFISHPEFHNVKILDIGIRDTSLDQIIDFDLFPSDLMKLETMSLGCERLKGTTRCFPNLRKLIIFSYFLDLQNFSKIAPKIECIKFKKCLKISENFNISSCESLSHIYWRHSDIQRLDNIYSPYLRHLDLAENEFKTLKMNFSACKSLKFLNLMDNNFESIPECVFDAPALEDLNLENNPITEINENICKLTSLKWLTLRSTKLRKIPDFIGKMTSLEFLRLDCCELDEIPAALGKCKNLRYLNLSLNYITKIPKSIAELPNLEYFNIVGNPVEKIPKRLQEIWDKCKHIPF